MAAVGVADLLARRYVEGQIVASTEQELRELAGVDAEISSFPFLGRIALFGSVDRLELRLDEILGRGVDVATLELRIDGLRLDRSSLLETNQVRITAIDSARLTANISEEALNAVVPVPGVRIDLVDDAVELTVAGRTVTAGIEVSDGRLTFRPPDPVPDVSLPLPSSELLPCRVSGRVRQDRLELTCVTDRLPQIVVDAIGSADLRDEQGRPVGAGALPPGGARAALERPDHL